MDDLTRAVTGLRQRHREFNFSALSENPTSSAQIDTISRSSNQQVHEEHLHVLQVN